MVYFYFFLKGLVTGITIAAIGGPVGILCIRRTISNGFKAGVAIGIGAALADALFGAISGFSLTIIADFLMRHQTVINVSGAAILLYLGIASLRENPEKQLSPLPTDGKKNILKNISTSFFITITNPATILFFAAVTVGLQIDLNAGFLAPSLMVGGIFLGSILWFSSLAALITFFHAKITPRMVSTINKIFGIGFIIFALYICIKTVRQG